MQISISILVGNANSGISYVKKLIKAFKARVLSYPNSIFEAEPCLDATLAELNAIGLLKDASLIITPNAYNEGILYDVVPNTTLGDMTVVRATTATRVNSAGLIEVVPRNLLSYSEQFNNAYWQKTSILVTPNILNDPNGNLTADLVASTVAGGYINNTNIVGSTGSVYTFSFYIKNNNSTASLVLLRASLSALQSTINWSGNTITSVTNSIGSINFASVGNDWYRITGTYTALESSQQLRIYPQSGVTTGSVYIWGAQLEQGSTATEYFPTTTRLNIPRIDYTNGSCPSLLVEPQRTNVLLRSQEFDNISWFKTNTNLNPNISTAPDGTLTADKASLTIGTNPLASDSTGVYQPQVLTLGTYNYSIFAKAGERNIIRWRDGGLSGLYLVVNLTNGTFTNQEPGRFINPQVIAYPNGWYRISFTTAVIASGSLYPLRFGDVGQTGDGVSGGFIWGAQLELGSYATSYIPTVASTVTRNADVISKTGISSLIDSEEGVLFLEASVLANDLTRRVISLSDGTLNNLIKIEFKNTSNGIEVALFNGATQVLILNTVSNELNFNKIAFKYKLNDFALFINGINVGTDLLGSVFPTNTLNTITFSLGGSHNFYGNVKQIQIYKTALSNTELAQLTTL